MTYFYSRALKEDPNSTVLETQFRYHCEKPKSREAALIMLTFAQMPEQGHYAIGDKPGWNRLEKLNKVLFDGEVVDDLTIQMTGIELDLMSADDELERYARSFVGDPASWVGHYEPADEGSSDPEAMSNWRICYDIEKP